MVSKVQNFSNFLNEISQNKELIATYQHLANNPNMLNFFVEQMLIPKRDNLDELVESLREQLDFNDEHAQKVKRYFQCFIEYHENGLF